MASLAAQVNMAASGAVESEANVTDIHEALHFDVLEEDGNDGFQRGFGIWSLAWAANGTEVVAGTGDDSLYLYNMERQKARSPGTCKVETSPDAIHLWFAT